MLTGRAARSGRHLARLLSSNPTTAAASLGAPETSAQQQLQLQDCRWLSSRSADSASCTGSAASSPGGHSRLAALLGLQRQSWRGFADGASTSGGPPRQRSGGPAPPSGAGQQQYGSGQRSGGRGDSPWQTPGGGELTPHSEPSQQEGEVDELLAKWEALMDVEANPLEVLDTVWSSLEGEQGLPEWDEILARGDEEEALERAARRSREQQLQEEFAEKRVRMVDRFGRSYATGKRKTSIARVWVKSGVGAIKVNGRTPASYFPSLLRRADVLSPFIVTSTLGAFDVYCTVRGGGSTGQAQAVRHGIARALQLFNPELRPALKAAGLLTRDPRIVERKKPGLAKARKSFQWVKR